MDLIPQDYRNYIQVVRMARLTAIATAALLLLFLALYGALVYASKSNQAIVEDMERKRAVIDQQQLVLDSLRGEKAILDKRLSVLEGLRGGAPAQDMFVAIDRSLEGQEVWFTSWSFKRSGSEAPRQAEGVSTGYFIVIPKGEGAKPQPEWHISTHMEIRGQARDHAALSRFVQRLLTQPQVADVRVINTQIRKYTQMTVVDFNLAIIVNNLQAGA